MTGLVDWVQQPLAVQWPEHWAVVVLGVVPAAVEDWA